MRLPPGASNSALLEGLVTAQHRRQGAAFPSFAAQSDLFPRVGDSDAAQAQQSYVNPRPEQHLELQAFVDASPGPATSSGNWSVDPSFREHSRREAHQHRPQPASAAHPPRLWTPTLPLDMSSIARHGPGPISPSLAPSSPGQKHTSIEEIHDQDAHSRSHHSRLAAPESTQQSQSPLDSLQPPIHWHEQPAAHLAGPSKFPDPERQGRSLEHPRDMNLGADVPAASVGQPSAASILSINSDVPAGEAAVETALLEPAVTRVQQPCLADGTHVQGSNAESAEAGAGHNSHEAVQADVVKAASVHMQPVPQPAAAAEEDMDSIQPSSPQSRSFGEAPSLPANQPLEQNLAKEQFQELRGPPSSDTVASQPIPGKTAPSVPAIDASCLVHPA